MSEHPWENLLDEEDRAVIENGGYGKPRGLGERPALLIIDCQQRYIGLDAPIAEQQSVWPGGGGAGAWQAVREIARLADVARANSVPVIHSRNVAGAGGRFDVFGAKLQRDPAAGNEIVEPLTPRSEDIVIDKGTASIFWGTPLDTYLVSMKVDSLILTGVSTSGCVRASLVDGVARGYSTTLVSDATADRIKLSYTATLLDVWMKYGNVVTAAEASDLLRIQG